MNLSPASSVRLKEGNIVKNTSQYMLYTTESCIIIRANIRKVSVVSKAEINKFAVENMSLEDLSKLIDQMVDRCDALEESNVAFLLSIAAEEMRAAAGLPEITPPSIYQADASTTETLNSSGEF